MRFSLLVLCVLGLCRPIYAARGASAAPEPETAELDGRAVTVDFLAHHEEKVPAVAQLVYNEFKKFYDEDPALNVNSWEDVARNYQEEYSNDNRVPFVLVMAADDGEVLGSITLEEEDGSAPKELHPWITDATVAEGGMGAGDVLFRALMRMASELQQTCLYVYTEDAAEREVDNPVFYKKFGFQELAKNKIGDNPVTVLVGAASMLPDESSLCWQEAYKTLHADGMPVAPAEKPAEEPGGGSGKPGVHVSISISMNPPPGGNTATAHGSVSIGDPPRGTAGNHTLGDPHAAGGTAGNRSAVSITPQAAGTTVNKVVSMHVPEAQALVGSAS